MISIVDKPTLKYIIEKAIESGIEEIFIITCRNKSYIENYFDKYKSTILWVQKVDEEDVSKYGIVDGVHIEDRISSVNDLVEKPSIEDAPSNEAIIGRYIINSSIFEILEHTKPCKGGEIQLTDALRELVKKENMYAYNFKKKDMI